VSTQSKPLDQLVGGSPTIAALRDQIRQLVTFDAVGAARVPPLLLEGETGTGKGLLARLVHDIGPRATGPFVDVSCSAIPETLLEAELFGFDPGAFTDARRAKPGLFEAASWGSLFLDEVQSLPAVLQGKLLRAIEDKRVRRLGAVADREVDVKLIAATQDDLATRVAEHRFRADLYHRLAVVVLTVPPVRERGDDVLLLAEHFLRHYAQVYGLEPRRLGPDAGAWLRRYPWPGNVRELSNVMERVMLLGAEPVVSTDTLARFCLRKATEASGKRAVSGAPDVLDDGSDDGVRVRHALERCGGNVVRAARFLGLTRSALRHRMQHYGIRRSTPERTAIAEGGQARPATEDAVGWTFPPITPTIQELKPVAVLAIELTSPEDHGERDRRHEETFTAHRRWTDEVVDRVAGFGGAILQRSPSLLLAAFGLPRALEQASHRAVQAALTIRQAAEDAPRGRTHDRRIVRLSVHLGTVLSDGEAVDPTSIVAVGETLALPVRLLGHTAPGQITVTAAVARQIDGPFVLEAEASRRAEDAELGVFRVVGPACTRSPAGHDGTRSGFVRRERELGNREHLLGEAETGRGQVVVIVADPALGRSRLNR
jgi:DNA-binding NtrC family response regulator